MNIEIDARAYCILSALFSMGLPVPLVGNSVVFHWFDEEKTGIYRGIGETDGGLRLKIQTGVGTFHNVRPEYIISIGKIPEEKLWKH